MPDPIHATRGFDKALPPVPVQDAVRRLLAYCTEPRSGWGAYDLAGAHARAAGLFNHVSAWSLLWANALNGQVVLDNVAAFQPDWQSQYATILSRIPIDSDVNAGDTALVDSVTDACFFGFPGVWGPKITKVGALYRPAAIPVLDGHVAAAFGFGREAFTIGARERRDRIHRVVRALATCLTEQAESLQAVYDGVAGTVPEIKAVPALRVLDMILWTSQDDTYKRRPKQGARWIDRPVQDRIPFESFAFHPLASAAHC